jgi:hypothetical protein
MKNFYFKIFSLITGLSFALIAIPVAAQTTTVTGSATVQINGGRVQNQTQAKAQVQTNLIPRIKTHADQEITRRIQGLNKLIARVNDMKKVSASVKSSLAAEVQTEIGNLTSLKAKIDAETDLTALRTDVKSITQSYRIYALIIPQGHILATADRALSIVDLMTAAAAKIQTRIDADKAAGKDVTAETSALLDFTAKVADAKIQAQAAITLVTGLTPDNGDQTKFQANKQALVSAREKIRVANQDLKTAEREVKQAVESLKISASVKGKAEGKSETHASTTRED